MTVKAKVTIEREREREKKCFLRLQNKVDGKKRGGRGDFITTVSK